MNIKKLFDDKNPVALALLEHWDEIAPAVEAYGEELRLEFFKKVYENIKKDHTVLLYDRYGETRYTPVNIDIILVKEKKHHLKVLDLIILFMTNYRIKELHILS